MSDLLAVHSHRIEWTEHLDGGSKLFKFPIV